MLRRSARCSAAPRRCWSSGGGGASTQRQGKGPAVGIDFGTSSTLVALTRSHSLEPSVLQWADGTRSQASVVHFPIEGAPIVGNAARGLHKQHPSRTVAGVKRLLGRSLAELPRGLLASLPYAVKGGKKEKGRVGGGDDATDASTALLLDLDGKRVEPIDIAALLMRAAKETAEVEAGVPLGDIVLTVPAQWTDAQRKATLEAARRAEFGSDVTLLSEPLAAALSFGLTSADAAPMVIVDVGGGTMDVSVLKAQTNSSNSTPSPSIPLFSIAAHAGDPLRGGQDFTAAVHSILAPQWRVGGIMLDDVTLAAEAEAEAEAVKLRLSGSASTEGTVGGVSVPISRSEAEAAMWPLVERLLDLCREALQEAKVRLKEVRSLLLVGGQSQAPIVRHSMRRFFQRDPLQNSAPEEAVVAGAAVHAALKQHGSALLVRDVTAFALGIECLGGAFLPVLPRGSPLPSAAETSVTTSLEAQGLIRLRVLQGNAPRAADNKLLGTATLFPLAPAQAGTPKLSVRFVLDAQGFLQVVAADPVSRANAKVVANIPPTLSEEDLLRLMREAQAAKRAEAEAEASSKVRAEAEAVLKYVEESLTNLSDRMPPDEAVELMTQVSSTRRALDAGRSSAEVEGALNSLRNQLRDALQRLVLMQDQQ